MRQRPRSVGFDAERAGEMRGQIGFRFLDREPEVRDAERHGGIITKPRDDCPGASMRRVE